MPHRTFQQEAIHGVAHAVVPTAWPSEDGHTTHTTLPMHIQDLEANFQDLEAFPGTCTPSSPSLSPALGDEPSSPSLGPQSQFASSSTTALPGYSSSDTSALLCRPSLSLGATRSAINVRPLDLSGPRDQHGAGDNSSTFSVVPPQSKPPNLKPPEQAEQSIPGSSKNSSSGSERGGSSHDSTVINAPGGGSRADDDVKSHSRKSSFSSSASNVVSSTPINRNPTGRRLSKASDSSRTSSKSSSAKNSGVKSPEGEGMT